MNPYNFNKLCNEILTLIEIEEAKLLSWGFVDLHTDLRYLLPDMLDRLPGSALALWQEAQDTGTTERDILKHLKERKLLFNTPQGGYRTRFAEAVRLFFMLRQRFSHEDWQTAARLVSDMKLHLQRRRYPKRELEVDELLAKLEGFRITALEQEAIRELLTSEDGSPFQLAQFQVEAMVQQFRDLRAREQRALVIGAGTGAGKTKAFYVPALAHIAKSLAKGQYRVQVLAIYPRTELLKDQLTEAFTEARKLEELLLDEGKRPITIGAYYGDTPRSAADFSGSFKPANWKQTEDGEWICPFFSCPHGDDHELLWEELDLKDEQDANKRQQYGQYAVLRCQSCDFEVDAKQLLLTREQMIRQPPDILFTTTEMLNRRLSRAREHALFGIGVSNPPRLVLLDEIHTYEGVTGAQVAYLLRRWRHARTQQKSRSHNLCIVGLSATLMQAESFFANLTGIPYHHVSYIFPREEDLIEEGIEYNIVLKGDPVSGTSLLSTSVQSAMLLARILDNGDRTVSDGAYGHKTFAFTDNLDVINRWYHIQYDAEWIKTRSQWRAKNDQDQNTHQARYQMGQLWRVCELIGHDLDMPLRLGRTTSQDRGVNRKAELIIATSTLEVGFNDPMVGAIIQHKAPHRMASFLQRKGRAGRKRGMRPWMVVVTSDYGRDRWVFQHAEMLFNPYLSPIELPIENYYIRKIQAAYVLMDWLALTLKKSHRHPTIDVWKALSCDKWNRFTSLKQHRQQICRLLRELLKAEGQLFDAFVKHLVNALDLKNDKAAQISILWGEPRSLLFEVIPTLLRQVESDWQVIEDGRSHKWKDGIASQPMPDFVPSALFTDLNLPEVVMRLPKSKHQKKLEREQQEQPEQFLSLKQALNEYVPGRANKRFVQEYKKDVAHWVALPEISQLEDHCLPITRLNIIFDRLPQQTKVGETSYYIYRPRLYHLNFVPENLRSTSYAQFIWQSHFETQNQLSVNPSTQAAYQPAPLNLSLEPKERTLSVWSQFFPRIAAFTQEHDTWVNVTRLATGIRVNTYYENGQELRAILNLVDGDAQPAAIGFKLAVDALQFTFEPLDAEKLMQASTWPSLYRHLGPQYFLYKLLTDKRLTEDRDQDLLLSRFEIEWLWQLELSMLVSVAIEQSITLQEAAAQVQRNRDTLADKTLRLIFQSQQAETDAGLDEASNEGQVGRLHEKLLDYIKLPVVQDALNKASAVLWHEHTRQSEKQGAELVVWLADCYASSLGATLFSALTRLVPDIEPSDLLMDVEDNSIWISEVTPAGVGLISKIADAISQRPRAFELQMLDTLEYCEREQLALQLTAVAKLLGADNQSLQQAFWQVRHETNLPNLIQSKELLTKTLETNGIPATRQLGIALNSKFLRPNSAEDSDELITTLLQQWHEQEERLGCAIDLRVISVAAQHIPVVRQKVEKLLKRIGEEQSSPDNSQICNLLQSLLWLNCVDSCPNCIQTWSPYQQQVCPSRALLRALLTLDKQIITYGTADWQAQVEQTLSTHYQLQLHCAQNDLTACKQALLTLLTTAIEIGFQLFYPIVERIERQQGQWIMHLVVRELVGD